MKLDYILSDTTKGATSAALREVVKEAENDIFGSFVIIVPETKSIIIEKELLSLSKRGSFANVFVYSFVRLLDRLGGSPSENTLNKQACIILLRKIIYENLSKLDCFKKTAKTIGFAEKIYETIAQLKSSGITPEELKLALTSTQKSLSAKLHDIYILYSEYEKMLGDNLLDDLDNLALLSNLSKTSSFLAESNVFIVGFDNITFEMQKVLKNLAASAKSITFSSVYFNENRKDKLIQNNELYLKFKHIAEELKYPYVPSFVKSQKRADFYHVQNYVFSSEKHSTKSNGNIKIFEAKTKKQEIDFVANTILKQIKSGRRFKDIGVLAVSLENDLDIIEKCFKLYNIPYFANVGKPISDHSLIKFIRSAFEIYSSNLSSDKVLKFMANPLFGCVDFSKVFLYVSETGANYQELLNEPDEDYIIKAQSYDEKFDDGENLNYKALLADLKAFRDFYNELSQKISGSKTAGDYINIISFLLEKFDVEGSLEKISSIERENGFVVQAEVSLSILKKIEKFNMQIQNFLGETEVPLDEFIGIYMSGLSSLKASVSPVSIDCVIIQSNTDGFFNIKDLFIVGANDGDFPSRIADSGIILDSELLEAKSLISKTIEPSVKDINRRENFKVYESLIEPSERLFLSYNLKSVSGKNNKPARAILNLINLFGEEIILKDYEKLDFVNYEILERQFALKINDYKNDRANLSDVNYIYGFAENHLSEKFKRYLENLEQGEKKFGIQNAAGLYFSGEKTSISQLQTYFDCPYRFFALYGLRLKERKSAKLASVDIGTIIHRVAEIFSKNITSFSSLETEEFNQKIQSLVVLVLKENKINIEKNKALVLSLFDECARLAKYILFEQENSSFKLKNTEFVFAGENAISLNLDDGKVLKIEGKIDRIDEFGNYIRIVDYKTGSVKTELKSIYNGQKIQLVSYLMALEKKGGKPAGLFYFPVHSDYYDSEKKANECYKMTGFILDDIDVVKHMDNNLSEENLSSNFVPVTIKIDKKTGELSFGGRSARYSEEELESISKYVYNLSKTAAEEILSGNIEPSPVADPNEGLPLSCRYCGLNGFCGLSSAKNHFGRSFNKKVDTISFEVGDGNGRD